MEGDQFFSITKAWGIEFFLIATRFIDQNFLSPQGLTIKKIWSSYLVAIENFFNCHKVWWLNSFSCYRVYENPNGFSFGHP
jgi:hypothetical protein